ncbi:hypothetical protein JCM15765_18930 [Paradesulfitobacterium aromaticivorans]
MALAQGSKAILVWDFRRLIPILYGVIPTFQKYPNFGRVYAAYGGIFVFCSLMGLGN